MTYTEQFVIINNLQPADATMLRKKFMGMLNHFAVYLGRHPKTNRPMFAANYTAGVQLLKENEVAQFLQKLEPEKIERFTGSNYQRLKAVDRALSEVGKRTYNLIFHNCEHYKNFVQFGKRYSKQVDATDKAAMIGGGVAAIAGAASGNNKALGWGLFALALGAIVVGAANSED